MLRVKALKLTPDKNIIQTDRVQVFIKNIDIGKFTTKWKSKME